MNGMPTAAAAGKIDVGGDLTVNRLGFGAMRITGPGIWGDPPDRDRAKEALRRAVALDVNFIDTADSYGPEVSERLIAEALYPYPEDLVIATKGGLSGRARGGGSPTAARSTCARPARGACARLRLDRIDLYQFHRRRPAGADRRFDRRAGRAAATQGKIRHVGVSNVTEDQFREAERVTAIVSVQNRYNVVDRSSEPMLDLCDLEMVVFIPWAPIEETGTIPALDGRRPASRRDRAAGGTGLAADPVAAGPADPRLRQPGTRRGERRGRQYRAHRRGDQGDHPGRGRMTPGRG